MTAADEETSRSGPPELSVVMPVRNGLPFLDAAVESILGQSFRDFEFVILDDGSSDGSTERLREWAARDGRIRLVEGDKSGSGLAGSSDRVSRLARAELIARMDADDICVPDRLERQLRVLRAMPDVVMVASLWEGMDNEGRTVHGPDRSSLMLPYRRPFLHGTIMYRRETFERVGGYRPGTDYFEDGDFYWRMGEAGRVLVLPEALLRYRWSLGSSRFDSGLVRVENAQQLGFRWGGRGTVPLETLDAWKREIEGRRVEPEVYVGLAYPIVWNGRRSPFLRRALARGRLRFDRGWMRSILWLLIAALAPRALRRWTRVRMERRDEAAAEFVRPGYLYQWPVRDRPAEPVPFP